MEAFVGKWVQVKDSHKNFDGMCKVMNIPPELAEKFKQPYSVEYKIEGEMLNAHFVLEAFGEKTYKFKLGEENVADGFDGKKYKGKLEIKDKTMKETSVGVDGGPQIITERTLEGKDSMVVKIVVGGVESGYRMVRK